MLAGGGHNDAWVGALILAALALSASRRAQAGGALWVLAIAVKWVPALFLALRSLESRATGRPHGARGLVGAAAGIAIGATVLYGGAWPLAIFPLVGNAALETSYAIPHRLEQLGLPDDLAARGRDRGAGGGARRPRPRAPPAGARDSALAACLVLVTTPYLAVWYLAWAVPVAAAEEDAVATVAVLALCAYLLPQTIPI